MVPLPEIKIPEKIEEKLSNQRKIETYEKIESKIKEQGKTKMTERTFKKEISEKGFEEKFSPEDYKKNLYSKIFKSESQYTEKTYSKKIDIEIPEIKSKDITGSQTSSGQFLSGIPSTTGSQTSSGQFLSEIPSWYIELLKKKIEENWSPKEFLTNLSAIISFRIYREGRIENIVIEKSSGYKNFDNSIIEAIKSVKKWPEFPREIKDRYLEIIIEFKIGG
jgi:TonB family protein